MAYTTVFNNIIFIEGPHPDATLKGAVKSSHQGQLKSIDNIKKDLASKAKIQGGNCICHFKYSQKSSLFSWDNTKFVGSDTIAKLPKDTYQKILAEKANPS